VIVDFRTAGTRTLEHQEELQSTKRPNWAPCPSFNFIGRSYINGMYAGSRPLSAMLGNLADDERSGSPTDVLFMTLNKVDF
jgi:hypothetical protein